MTPYGATIRKMNRNNVFEQYAAEYDEWFNVHVWVYYSEIKALEMFLPKYGKGVEIGIGTGRFSTPFGIKTGVEPSKAMAEIARSRGIEVYDAKAENLPFNDDSFDFAFIVTTICFLDNPLQALKEIRRILHPNGKIVIGMLDKDSPLGKEYESKKRSSKFYQYANFYSVKQILEWLTQLEYHDIQIIQTIFKRPENIKAIEPIKEGYGEGLFVVISACCSFAAPLK
jgi:ubiquinone/menaquinone biosynthesis C-methylase UbiE